MGELKQAINTWLSTKTKTINTKINSYSIKNLFEELLGCYVSNDDLKTAMHDLGYKHKEVYPTSINEHYNISMKDINFLKGELKRRRELEILGLIDKMCDK